MPGRATIALQPNGAKSPLVGTEKFPISGSQYVLASVVAAYANSLAPYVLTGETIGNSPADNTAYYFGSMLGSALTGTAATRRIYVPRAGTITRVTLFVACNTGTNEQSTISLRLNNTTNTVVTSTLALNTQPVTVHNTSISVAVVAGDYFEFKWDTPSGGWATNPTAVNISAQVWVT